MPSTESKFCRLFFLRHGDAAVPPEHYPNHETMPLSPLGRGQAIRVAKAMTNFKINRIVASPLQRAIETAEYIAQVVDLSIEVDARLSERVFKSFYDLSYEKIERDFGRDMRIYLETGLSHLVEVTNEETIEECTERVLSCISDLVRTHPHKILVVAHGGPHEWLLKALLKINSTERLFTLGKCRLSVLDFQLDSAALQRIVGINLSSEDADLMSVLSS